MSDLFLIAHKVRGEAAFDVAIKMRCPECGGTGGNNNDEGDYCQGCDGEGDWWIIPTSGHRAYPYHWRQLEMVDLAYANAMPESLPDHYPTSASPSRPAIDISSLLVPAPKIKFDRRF